MSAKKILALSAFNYILPEEKIAQFPLPNRASSKLLVYQGGEDIQHHQFHEVVSLLPKKSMLFLNDTKVIPARLKFRKSSGALIELFLLQPLAPEKEIERAMLAQSPCSWECMIGNLKKWKEHQTLSVTIRVNQLQVTLVAAIIDRSKQQVSFSWDKASIPFVDIIAAIGNTPLPPYIDRELQEDDEERYQTVYSSQQGAVAAPTAGLHFNDTLMKQLVQQEHKVDFLTLHVGAGTFQPVKAANVHDHPMHQEQIIVSKTNIVNLLAQIKRVIAVGTTSMRTLESLYWFGVKVGFDHKKVFHIEKDFPYQHVSNQLPTPFEALQEVLHYMEDKNLEKLTGTTEIMIYPGYDFKICKGLITNFHMPCSTLIMLIAAFIGPNWKKVYHAALENDYRFLSYGDSSLLLPS